MNYNYMCKKCGHVISQEMMFSARVSYEEMFGHPAPQGVPNLIPMPLPRCPYCGSWQDKIGDYWFFKPYELRYGFALKETIRHQRNVEWEGEMEAEAKVIKGIIIRNEITDLQYFRTFAEVRKEVKARRAFDESQRSRRCLWRHLLRHRHPPLHRLQRRPQDPRGRDDP